MRSRMVAGMALIVALAVPLAWAQWRGGPGEGFVGPRGKSFGGRHHRGFGLHQFLNDPAFRERVGITAEQAERIRAQGMTAAKARVRLRADRELRQMELAELLQAEKPDRASIDKKLRELADLHYAEMKAHTDDQLAMREIIAPEQRAKIRAFAQERMREFRRSRGEPGRGPGRFRGPREPGGPPGPPPGEDEDLPEDE